MRTVRELIEELQRLPPDALIGVLSDCERDSDLLFPVQIIESDVIAYERVYCAGEDDFNQRLGYDSDFIEKEGYWLTADSGDMPQQFVLCDDDGEMIRAEWEE